MNGRALRSSALRLIAVAAVALGIALVAGASLARVATTLSDDSGQGVAVVSTNDGSTGAPLLAPGNVDAPAELGWS